MRFSYIIEREKAVHISNHKLENDQKLTTYDDIQKPVEVDSIEYFKLSQSSEFAEYNNFLIYQHQSPLEESDGEMVRYFRWLDKQTAETLANTIKGGPTKKIIMICTMFESGAIKHFADTLLYNSQKNKIKSSLDMLGLFWYLSMDDITDVADYPKEIAYAVNNLEIKRISILTGEFNDQIENQLVEELKDNNTLEKFMVFQKDDKQEWPIIPTPKIDSLLKKIHSSKG